LRKFSSDGYNNQKTIRVSISNARTEDVSVHDLFLEVTVASLIYERLSFENEYVFYDDVRVFEAVLQKISKSDIEDIIRSYLSVVKRYDILNNTDLENTLKSLINNRMSTTATANELFIHNNTVLQRKNKIASLFEQDPFSSDCYKTLETIFMLKDLFEIKL
jgi:DNA-binding PucR family transcriptional regulator